MKKYVSLILALVMVCSLSVVAFAEDPSHYTTVVYTGANTDEEGNHSEYYEVVVPPLMAPGDTDIVRAEGYFPTTRQLNVSAPETVVLTCDIDGSTKTLDVTFTDITLVGSNTAQVATTENISVEGITEALFGTWGGTIIYTVGMSDVVAD